MAKRLKPTTDTASMAKPTETIESFAADHTAMKAPQIRPAGLCRGPAGDVVSKYDLRLVQPNTEALPTAAMHSLEHLLASFLRESLEGVIDLSPMGCRTGFYLSLWGEPSADEIQRAVVKALRKVVACDWSEVPGVSERECGNYRDHSLFSAKAYARQVLEGFDS